MRDMKILLLLVFITPNLILTQSAIETIYSVPLSEILTDNFSHISSRKTSATTQVSVKPNYNLICGKLYDGETVRPIQYGAVTLKQNGHIIEQAETSVIGIYYLRQIKTGNYTLEISAEGYETNQIDILYTSKYESISFNFELYLSDRYEWSSLFEAFVPNEFNLAN